jgi:hypothetical protein
MRRWAGIVRGVVDRAATVALVGANRLGCVQQFQRENCPLENAACNCAWSRERGTAQSLYLLVLMV